MSVEADVIYKGDLHCEAKHAPSGETILTDAPIDIGGKGEAFSPTDLVGAALGTCIVTSMATLAKRNNIELAGTTAHVAKEMTSAPPRRIAELKVIVTMPKGMKLSETDRAKLEGAGNACPVHKSLHPETKVTIEYRYS
jgi:putative redox protein